MAAAKTKLVKRLITKKIHGDRTPRRRPSVMVQSGNEC
jgi:hypothetical protein